MCRPAADGRQSTAPLTPTARRRSAAARSPCELLQVACSSWSAVRQRHCARQGMQASARALSLFSTPLQRCIPCQPPVCGRRRWPGPEGLQGGGLQRRQGASRPAGTTGLCVAQLCRCAAGLLTLLLLPVRCAICRHALAQSVKQCKGTRARPAAVAAACAGVFPFLQAPFTPNPAAVPTNNEELWSSVWVEVDEGGRCTGLSQASTAGGGTTDSFMARPGWLGCLHKTSCDAPACLPGAMCAEPSCTLNCLLAAGAVDAAGPVAA